MTHRRPPSAHAITEHATLLNARRAADYILQHPQIVERAMLRLETDLASHRRSAGLRLWREVLRLPLTEVVGRMIEESPSGRLLRSNNPFSTVLPQDDELMRRRTWRQAKAELSSKST